jgi:hypothetical protein
MIFTILSSVNSVLIRSGRGSEHYGSSPTCSVSSHGYRSRAYACCVRGCRFRNRRHVAACDENATTLHEYGWACFWLMWRRMSASFVNLFIHLVLYFVDTQSSQQFPHFLHPILSKSSPRVRHSSQVGTRAADSEQPRPHADTMPSWVFQHTPNAEFPQSNSSDNVNPLLVSVRVVWCLHSYFH